MDICHENYGSTSRRKQYIREVNGRIAIVEKKTRYKTVSQFFRSVFLPQGYPESVSPDYLNYQFWDSLQAFASSINGALAGQAVLKGVGVGDENATVLAATITWLLRHGVGMVGSLVFTWLQGTSLDYDAKRWRMFADVLNDASFFIEILAPMLPFSFTVLACIASIARSLVGVAGGATRAAFTQHQARRNNMADVSAKDGSQETLVNLSALICNLLLIPYITGNHVLIWMLFVSMTFFHIYANYRAVRAVIMESVNQARLHCIINEFNSGREVTPKKINLMEPVFIGTKRLFKINLGCSLEDLSQCSDDLLLFNFYKDDYLLGIDLNKKIIHIVLHEGSSVFTQLMACCQAETIEYVAALTSAYKDVPLHMMQIGQAYTKRDLMGLLHTSYAYTTSNFNAFHKNIQAHGWVTDKPILGADEWRADWNFTHRYTGSVL